MSLVVFLSPHQTECATFWIDQESGQTGMGTPLEDLAERAAGHLVLALPGEEAATRRLHLPVKGARDARRAARLALDDQLASPIPSAALALSPPDEEGCRTVSLLPLGVIEDGLAAAEEAGLDADCVTADHALVPPSGAGASRLALGARDCVRLEGGAFTAERAFADTIIENFPLTDYTLADLLPGEQAPNFRSGPLAKKRPLPSFRPYRLAASLALAAGVTLTAASFVEGVRYGSEGRALTREAEAAFQSAYPGTPIFDLERQLAGQARTSGPYSDFLPLTAILAEVLDDKEDAALSSLSYAADGQLTAELTFARFADLEALSEALSARGVAIEEGDDARREDGAFVTRLYLRAS